MASTGPMKVLISAYACEPAKGSEPGVGWNIATQAARWNEVWVVTRANNRPVIEEELARHPVPKLHMIYHDLPQWARWWKRGVYGARFYYYLWQLTLYPVLRRLDRQVRFHVTHHATFVKYSAPSLLALLPAPFLWGPVGGGEDAPKPLWIDGGWRGRAHELLRSAARWIGEQDPLVLATARRSALALAATGETAGRVRALGARQVEILCQLGLTAAERSYLAGLEPPAPHEPVRFVSLGNLLHWKGFHLGLRAFAAAHLPGTEYWVVGDGPFRAELHDLSRSLGIADRVRFWGTLPRAEALRTLSRCHVLVHPSLHDSGALVCLEAMAAGKPVVCLDLGGPGALVTGETGFKLTSRNPDGVVEELASAIRALAVDPALRVRMGQAGRERVASEFTWERKGELVNRLYRRVARTGPHDG
jgi:glycosyltransferase involved in cell wall biosynthesis